MPVRHLSPNLQKISEDELHEVPDRIQEDLKHIRDWLAQQRHLTVRTDDQWLLNFLRGSKFSLQRTKEKLDRFYTVKTMLPELFSNRDPFLPEIQDWLSLGLCLPLLLTDQSGSRVIIYRCHKDPLRVPIITGVKAALMIGEILRNEDDNFVVAGTHILVDNQGATINHLLPITPSICKKVITCLQNYHPTRSKGFHFINTFSIFETIFNIVNPMLTKKLRDRIHVLDKNDLGNLYKIIPLSILPKEYGGEGDSLDELTDYWKKKVESYRDWFLEDAQYCSNEKLRPGKAMTVDEMLGIEGSFRKLDID